MAQSVGDQFLPGFMRPPNQFLGPDQIFVTPTILDSHPVTVIQDVFGYYGDTSSQQAYQRADQVSPPYDAAGAVRGVVSNAVNAVTAPLQYIGLALAAFVIIFIISFFRR
jgi:hypothetical protein